MVTGSPTDPKVIDVRDRHGTASSRAQIRGGDAPVHNLQPSVLRLNAAVFGEMIMAIETVLEASGCAEACMWSGPERQPGELRAGCDLETGRMHVDRLANASNGSQVAFNLAIVWVAELAMRWLAYPMRCTKAWHLDVCGMGHNGASLALLPAANG